jgi:hypothetical protein
MRTYITIAVIGIVLFVLSGVGVCGVYKLREAGARTSCRNNLHQLAITIANYEATYLRYPQATIPNDALPPQERLSWLVDILPFVESDARYSTFDLKKGWQVPHNQIPGAGCLYYLLCPSGNFSSRTNVTDYVGLSGIGPDAALLPKESPRAGMFGFERTITKKDITDGSSTTILATETAVNNGPWAAGGPATVRYLDPNDQPYIGIDRPFGRLHGAQPWSGFTSPITQAVFVDGHVGRIGPDIDPRVFEALVTIAGGEQVPDEY